MRQVATLVSGSNSRKLAQPLVPQKSRFPDWARLERRRSRRMAVARPVADVVADRVIMVLVLVLSGAPSSRYGRSAGRPWVVRALMAPATLVCSPIDAFPGAWFGRSTGSQIGTFDANHCTRPEPLRSNVRSICAFGQAIRRSRQTVARSRDVRVQRHVRGDPLGRLRLKTLRCENIQVSKPNVG